MNKENRKAEKIEKAEQAEQVDPAEQLSERELENIVGGGKTVNSSKSNTSSF